MRKQPRPMLASLIVQQSHLGVLILPAKERLHKGIGLPANQLPEEKQPLSSVHIHTLYAVLINAYWNPNYEHPNFEF